jgi:hypothetical protein
MNNRKLSRLVWINCAWVQAAHKYNGRWAWYYCAKVRYNRYDWYESSGLFYRPWSAK